MKGLESATEGLGDAAYEYIKARFVELFRP